MQEIFGTMSSIGERNTVEMGNSYNAGENFLSIGYKKIGNAVNYIMRVWEKQLCDYRRYKWYAFFLRRCIVNFNGYYNMV